MSLRMLKTCRATLAGLLVAVALPAMAEDLQMWERSGGNQSMVELLIAAWNEKNPDRQIEDDPDPVARDGAETRAGHRFGEVPDLMGMDLIYGPQFEAAGQLVDITDQVKDWPELKTASPGHMMVSTYKDRIYGVPLYADVSVLYWNKRLFKAAGLDPEVGPQSLGEIKDMAKKITGIEDGASGYFLAGNCAGCNIFTFAPLIWASGGTVEPTSATDEPLKGESVKQVFEWARSMWKEGLIKPEAQAVSSEDFHLQFATDKYGIFGTGNFNLALLQSQNPAMFDHVGVTLPAGSREGSGGLVRRRRHRDDPEGVQACPGRRRLHEVHPLRRGAGRGLCQEPQSHDPRGQGRQPVLHATRASRRWQKQSASRGRPIPRSSSSMINSPQGPWLQGLQRVYFSDDPIDTIIADMKAQMSAIAAE